MKFYLLLILFILCVGIAVFIYLRYYIRYVLYKDMLYICKSFKSNISFKKLKIKEIYTETTSHLSLFTRNILNQKFDNTILVTKKDINTINDFLNSVGKGDVEFEINNISFYENNFSEMKDESKTALDKDGKMYLKLIIGIGLALCIILI